jgi:hypothetical protein
MRVALTALLLASCSIAAAQDKSSTGKFESKEGKYSVQFPDKPEKSSRKSGGVELHIAMSKKGMGGFAVIHSDLPPEAVKVARPKTLLDGGQKGLVDNFKAKVTSARDFEFGPAKYPARELIAEKDKLHLRVQIILVENRLYQVLVVGSKDLTAGKDSDAFFKSFAIAR